MGSAADFYEDMILDAILGVDHAPNMPDTVHIALFIEQPNDSNSLAFEVPGTGTGYARVAVPNDGDHWMVAVSGVKRNAAKIQFPLASGAWGECRWWGIYDAATFGNLIVWGELPSYLSPTSGNAPYFDSGGLAVLCD